MCGYVVSYLSYPNYQGPRALLCLLLRIYWWKQGCKCGLLQIHVISVLLENPLWHGGPEDPWSVEERRSKEFPMCISRCVCVCLWVRVHNHLSSHHEGCGHELGQFFPFCLQRGAGTYLSWASCPVWWSRYQRNPAGLDILWGKKYWPVTVAFSLFPGRRATLPVSPTALRSTRIP